jgi:hypothetical protein
MSRNFKIASVLSLTVPVALVLIPFTWPSSDTLLADRAGDRLLLRDYLAGALV